MLLGWWVFRCNFCWGKHFSKHFCQLTCLRNRLRATSQRLIIVFPFAGGVRTTGERALRMRRDPLRRSRCARGKLRRWSNAGCSRPVRMTCVLTPVNPDVSGDGHKCDAVVRNGRSSWKLPTFATQHGSCQSVDLSQTGKAQLCLSAFAG